MCFFFWGGVGFLSVGEPTGDEMALSTEDSW